MSQPTPADFNDIQGDIILQLPKRVEDFIFFQITDVAGFKKGLKDLIPAITTTAQVMKTRQDITDNKSKGILDLIKISQINIAFSFKGLTKLGITDHIQDQPFEAGQFSHAQNLKDQGNVVNGQFDPIKWLPAFKSEVDGVVLLAGDSKVSVSEGTSKVDHLLGQSIKKVLCVEGVVRPGKEKGHEHFGFLDGISNPAIASITPPLPGQRVVNPGVLVFGYPGDPVVDSASTQAPLPARPTWTKNGSLLAYRHLTQLVPEFSKFLHDNPIDLPGLPRDQGSELLGARMVGRWKSGAPIDITPLKDDPALGADPQRNNNFDFSQVKDQTKCPFAAHVRKTNPRTDLPLAADQMHAINRTGIPFGPEVTPHENQTGVTELKRGLAFVCYQSSLTNGFEFLQESWANNPGFPINKPIAPGIDPIIGQNGNDTRSMSGINPNAQSNETTFPIEFVVSNGGEYFISPSITALKTKFSA